VKTRPLHSRRHVHGTVYLCLMPLLTSFTPAGTWASMTLKRRPPAAGTRRSAPPRPSRAPAPSLPLSTSPWMGSARQGAGQVRVGPQPPSLAKERRQPVVRKCQEIVQHQQLGSRHLLLRHLALSLRNLRVLLPWLTPSRWVGGLPHHSCCATLGPAEHQCRVAEAGTQPALLLPACTCK
jgi:hypothetical protein